MKKMNKLVALLLAAVMVLGMLPAATAHAHEYHTHGVEEYPVIALDTPTLADISVAGNYAYFAFTPEATDLYCFYSSTDFGYCDPYGTVYDAEMNPLNSVDDGYSDTYGVSSPNFFISQVMEAGVTYVLEARLYSTGGTGTYNVTLTQGHSYASAVTTEHTCTEDGVLTWTCSYCGNSYDEPIPAAHTWGEDGVCTVCGEVYLITGVCGDALTWELDWFGTMTISGTGEMYDYFYSWEENTPSEWNADYNTDIKKVVIEEGCTSIGEYAFYQANNLAEVSIPASVTEIGGHAFDNTALTAIEIPETVTTLGEGAFASNFNLASAKLPSGLTAIPASCFEYCGSLSEVVWPAAAASIGDKAFYNCNLGNLIVPEGVTYIGASAFGGNSEMTQLTLPSTLAELADRAFSSCWSVTDFVFTGSAPVMPDYIFNWVTANVWYPVNNASWTADVMQQYGGTLTWKPICSTHAYGEVVTVPATCETGEYKTRTCATCGWVDNSPAGEPLGHDYVYTVIEPNCATYEYGRTEITCTRCDYYSSENWVYPEHSYETAVIAPTCTEDGYTQYTCTACGSSYTDSYVYATGHVVESWSEPSEATCTDASVKTGTCTVCSETVTEEVSPALGHTWDEENFVENEDGSVTYTCTVCGATYQTEGTSLYLGDNAFTITGRTGRTTKTFTAPATGKLTITINDPVYHNAYAWDNGWTDQYWQPLGINWCFGEGYFNIYINNVNTGYTGTGDYEIILNTVDVTAGDVVTVEFNHMESSPYYTNDFVCNMNLALEAVHVHTEQIIPGYEATFDAPGMTEGKVCSECGEVLVAQEEIPMLNYNDGIIPLEVLEVSCGDYETDGGAAEGPAYLAMDDDLNTIWHTDWQGTSRENHWIQFELTEAYTVDGLRYKPRITGNTNGIITGYDILVSDDGVNFESVATGTWEGDRNWKVVEFDGRNVKYVRLLAVDALTDNSWVFACAAEIRLTGEKAPDTHEHSYEAVVTAPTCTEGGYTTYTCSCGESYTADETEALGHDYVAEVTEATCTDYGFTTYTCTRCDDSYIDEDSWVEPEHSWDEGVVTAPTCTEQGYTTYTCQLCGESYVDEDSYTDALGHAYVNGKCSVCGDLKTGTFEDVPAGSFCFDAVEWAVEEGITTGTTPTTFNPTGNLLRAEVVTMLWRAAGKPEPASSTTTFTDVKEGSFYYKAVLWAVEQGITTGTSATTFDPAGVTNRAQAVTFLWRANGKTEPTSTENPFTDVTEKSFCYKAVLWAVENNITTGVSTGKFGTADNCNRAQMVTFLYRTAQLTDEPEVEEPEGEKYLVLLKAIGNGTILCDVNEAAAGQKVTFTAIPDEGYALTQFKIFDPYGEIDLSTFQLEAGANENEYVFTMIAHDLIVDCVFEVYP